MTDLGFNSHFSGIYFRLRAGGKAREFRFNSFRISDISRDLSNLCQVKRFYFWLRCWSSWQQGFCRAVQRVNSSAVLLQFPSFFARIWILLNLTSFLLIFVDSKRAFSSLFIIFCRIFRFFLNSHFIRVVNNFVEQIFIII